MKACNFAKPLLDKILVPVHQVHQKNAYLLIERTLF
jgi:hypothetical protein